MRPLRYLLVGLLMPAAPAALAICLNPFGCEPSTLAECRAVAVKLPTERGVSIALGDCQKKFVTEPEEACASQALGRLVKD